jgi:Fe-S-cluster containining protein
MFEKIYRIYEKEIVELPFVCRAGCSTCCTQSVTMTTAEGGLIRDYLRREGRVVPELPETAGRSRPACTTNGLAACCLEEMEAPPEIDEPWIYEPCLFLADDRCTIYPVRPFACRSFASLSSCAESGVAEVPDWFISLNIVVSQLIEHLDRDGRWGNMIDVLRYLESGESGVGQERLLASQPVPGLLVMREELPVVDRFLVRLADAARGDDVLQELVLAIRATLPGRAGP